MTATVWRFQGRKRETALSATLDVQNCTFSNSEFQLHESNFFLLSKPLSIYIAFVGQEVGQISPNHFIASREDQPAQVKRKRTPIEKKLGLPKKKAVDIPKMSLDSPLMDTRSKAVLPSSLAMSPRSKRRLSL